MASEDGLSAGWLLMQSTNPKVR